MNPLIKIKNRINCWIVRRILKSALVFEPDSYKLYISIREAAEKYLADSKGKKGDKNASSIADTLNSLINQEKSHERLAIKIVNGEMKCSDLKTAFKEIPQIHLNNIKNIRPFESEVGDSITLKIAEAIKQEEDSLKFYSGLYRMSKLGSAREAFKLLADQEAVHLIILKKLAGKDVFLSNT